MDISQLDERVAATMEHKVGCASHEQISVEIAALLQQDPTNDEARALNYKWQCHLNREYIEAHDVDGFLERLTDHLLAIKSEHPVAEMLIALEKESKTQK